MPQLAAPSRLESPVPLWLTGEIMAMVAHPGGRLSDCNVLELSPTDLRLVMSQPPALLDQLAIDLTSYYYGFQHGAIGWVHRVRQLSAHSYEVGIFLDDPLPESVIKCCWSDLRCELRFDGQWAASLSSQRRGRTEAIEIVNYSRLGILLATSNPLDYERNINICCGNETALGKVRCATFAKMIHSRFWSAVT